MKEFNEDELSQFLQDLLADAGAAVSREVHLRLNQCCVVFSMDDDGVKGLQNYMNKMTLQEFLGYAQIPYLMR